MPRSTRAQSAKARRSSKRGSPLGGRGDRVHERRLRNDPVEKDRLIGNVEQWLDKVGEKCGPRYHASLSRNAHAMDRSSPDQVAVPLSLEAQ